MVEKYVFKKKRNYFLRLTHFKLLTQVEGNSIKQMRAFLKVGIN